MSKASPVVRCLFEAAFAAVANGNSWRYCPILNLLFTKVVGGIVGGRMKCGISGGGPLSPEVQNFCRIAFGFPLIQGYALTETCCAGCVQLPTDSEDGIVGAPLASVQIRLESCKDVPDKAGQPYLDTDKTHPLRRENPLDLESRWITMDCAERGEVWIRGPSVSMGYYAKGEQRESLQKKTLEEFSEQYPNKTVDHYDWFKTGDIALMTPDGRLKIVDRKKNLVKMKHGEYIAIENMESNYVKSKYVNMVNGGIMVHGDGDIDAPIALVQAQINTIRDDLPDVSERLKDDVALCQSPEAIKLVKDDLVSQAKSSGMGKIEWVKEIALISGSGNDGYPGDVESPWTPENGYQTASKKIDRGSIKNGKKIGDAEGQSASFLPVLEALREKVGANGPLA